MDKISASIIDSVINEIQKEKNMEKMRTKIIDPIILHTFQRLYPYILGTSVIFISTFMLALAIFLFNIRIHYK